MSSNKETSKAMTFNSSTMYACHGIEGGVRKHGYITAEHVNEDVIKRDRYTHLKNVTVVSMMAIRILSRHTTYGFPEASPTSGVGSNDRCGGRVGNTSRMQFFSWLGLRGVSAGLLGDVALGSP